jgi:hypothetical protein
MAKPKELSGPGKCVYCLRFVENVTSDHVIPRSWFSKSTPANVELPQAPACEECNSYWGKVESALREQLGFAIEPYIPGGEGIGDKSLRAIDPSKGKNPKDVEKRRRNQDQLRRRLRRVSKLPEGMPLIPNIGQIPPSIDGEYVIDAVNPVIVEKVIRKWVTGLTYHYVRKSYIDPQVYVVQAKVLGQEPVFWLRTGGLRKKYKIGPGMIIERQYASDDPLVSFWIFSVWGKFEFLGAVVRLDYILEQAASLFR